MTTKTNTIAETKIYVIAICDADGNVTEEIKYDSKAERDEAEKGYEYWNSEEVYSTDYSQDHTIYCIDFVTELEETETTTFATITEATEYVETALGEFAADYDLEAIAREVTEWIDGKLTLTAEGDEFWAIAAEHDTTAKTIKLTGNIIQGDYVGAPMQSGKPVDEPTDERVIVVIDGTEYERTVYARVIWRNMGKSTVKTRFVIVNGTKYEVE